MGWSIGFDTRWQRDIGYSVPSICDHPGCTKEIHRGLSYVCGTEPFGGEHGCGLYFCEAHRLTAGDKRENASLCTRCYYGKQKWHIPKPDVAEWVNHKLTDPSWGPWRKANPAQVTRLRALQSSNHQQKGQG